MTENKKEPNENIGTEILRKLREYKRSKKVSMSHFIDLKELNDKIGNDKKCLKK